MFMRREGIHIRLICLYDMKRARLLAALALRSEFQCQVLPYTFVSLELCIAEKDLSSFQVTQGPVKNPVSRD